MYFSSRNSRGQLACAITLVSLVSPLQAADPAALVADKSTFVETLDRSVSVSGQLLTGIMHDPQIDAQPLQGRLDQLSVSFAFRTGLTGEKVCFKLASQDGAYTAKWTSTLATDIDSSARVSFETAHRGALEALSTNSLVALASIGTDCNTRDSVYLPTGWGDIPADGPASITLYMNTDTPAAYAAARYTSHSKVAPEDCTILPSTQDTTTFDTLCRLPLTVQDGPVELAVLRENGSSTLPPLRYPLAP